MGLHLFGQPSVEGRAGGGLVRHAEIEPVHGLHRHVALKGGAVFAAPQQGVLGQRGPSAGVEMLGLIRVDVDVVDLVRHEPGQSRGGDLLVAGRKSGDVFHVSVGGMGRGLIAHNSTPQMSRERAPKLNIVVMLIWASRTTPPM